jgi:transcriptional regulator GlxA family with amidase domain
MKKISILIPQGSVITSSIVPAFEILSGVNQYLIGSKQCESEFFDIELVGLTKTSVKYNGLITFNCTKTIEEVKAPDLILISTISGDMEQALQLNADFIPWIFEQREKYNSEIASFCSSAFLLAETGLLNGKSASTHWASADLFRKKYPQIELISEAVITDEDGIYTSGGAFSFLNLLLYIIEKYCGRETAIWCSKMFEIDFNRYNQNQFVIFSGQKGHDDAEIKNAQNYIENNYGNKISIDHLASTFAMSSRNFIRRFKKATMNTPSEYIQRVKVEAAKKSLESQREMINEVMYNVGYSDPKAFRDIFKKHTGLSPNDYKQKYNRVAV